MKKRIYRYLNVHGWLSGTFLCQQVWLCMLIKNQITDGAAWTKIIGFTLCQTLIILMAPPLLKVPCLYRRFAWFDTLPTPQRQRLLNRHWGAYRRAQTHAEKNHQQQSQPRHQVAARIGLQVIFLGIRI